MRSTATSPETSSVAARPDRFPCFDGLRAVAALSVVVYHVTIQFIPGWIPSSVWNWLTKLGSFGVCIFFVISGFLLYRPFVAAHFEDRATPNIRGFWRRRFFRIFPAYWLALTAAVVGFGFFSIHGFSNFVTYYGLLQNYRAGYSLSGIAVAWTLVIEVSFYIALPLIALILRGRTRTGSSLEQKLRAQVQGLVGLYVLTLAVRIWQLWIYSGAPPTHGQWFPLNQVYVWLIGYLDWFLFGMAMAIASAWFASGRRVPLVIRLLGDHPGICWLLAAETYWVCLQLNLPIDPFARLTRTQTFGRSLFLGLVAILIIFPAVFGDQDRGLLRRFLRTPVMVWLGTISYGIYLWHKLFVDQVVRWTADGWVPSNFAVQVSTIVVATVGVATLSYYLLERPLIRRSQRGPKNRSSISPAPEAAEDPSRVGTHG